MKFRSLFLAAFIGVFGFGIAESSAEPPSTEAVLIGNAGSYNAFFRNAIAQVGARPNGSFGSDVAVPADGTWYPQGRTTLGFVALREGTDWLDDTIDGDFFLPGTPYEGWGIQVGNNSPAHNLNGSTGVSGSFEDFGSGATESSTPEVVWRATQAINDVTVSQRYYLPNEPESTLTMKVSVTNSAVTEQTIYYFRGVDPDNCMDKSATAPCSGHSYTTTNSVLTQVADGDPVSAVVASSLDGSNLVLWSDDPGAVVAVASYHCRGTNLEEIPTTPRTFDSFSSPATTSASGCVYINKKGATEEADIDLFLVVKQTVEAGGSASFTVNYSLSAAAFEEASGVSVSPPASPVRVTPPPPPPPTTVPPSTAPSTTTTTTSVPPVTSVPVPVPVDETSGELPELAPGESQVLIDGVAETVEVVVEEVVPGASELVMRSDDFELRLNAECVGDCQIRTDASGRQVLELEDDGTVAVQGEGFLVGTQVYVWMFSDPTYLGELTVLEDGTFAGALPVPNLGAGTHTLQVNGTSFDGRQRSANLGVEVKPNPSQVTTVPTPDPVTLPATGSASSSAVMWLAMVLLVAGALVASTRRRTSA